MKVSNSDTQLKLAVVEASTSLHSMASGCAAVPFMRDTIVPKIVQSSRSLITIRLFVTVGATAILAGMLTGRASAAPVLREVA